MAIVLGGLALNPHMIWTDRYNSDNLVASSLARTLGGRAVMRSRGLSGVRNITLEATEEQGWLTAAQVSTLYTMAAQPGAVFDLTIGQDMFSVSFRHHESPAFSANQLEQIGAQAPAGHYTASLKLYSVT